MGKKDERIEESSSSINYYILFMIDAVSVSLTIDEAILFSNSSRNQNKTKQLCI